MFSKSLTILLVKLRKNMFYWMSMYCILECILFYSKITRLWKMFNMVANTKRRCVNKFTSLSKMLCKYEKYIYISDSTWLRLLNFIVYDSSTIKRLKYGLLKIAFNEKKKKDLYLQSISEHGLVCKVSDLRPQEITNHKTIWILSFGQKGSN